MFFLIVFFYHRANVTDMTFKQANRTLYKARQEAYPRSPTNITEINDIFNNNEHVRKTFGLTKRADENLQTNFFKSAIEGKNYSACIFASDDIIGSIQDTSSIETRLLYADATFSITPIGIFKQVLILFADIYTYVSLIPKISICFERVTSNFSYFFFSLFFFDCSIRSCHLLGY